MKLVAPLAFALLIVAGCAANHTKSCIELIERTPPPPNSGMPDAQLLEFIECVQELQSYESPIVGIALKSARDTTRSAVPFEFRDKLHMIVRLFYEVPIEEQGVWRVEVKGSQVGFAYPNGGRGPGLSAAEEFGKWQGKYPKRDLDPLLRSLR